MRRALREFVVEGIKTTIPLHKEIFELATFVDGHVDTTFIERYLSGKTKERSPSRT
jgi:acetyl-CoA carboxylase biotin carboxylase subunit